jgi:hypothetical protein
VVNYKGALSPSSKEGEEDNIIKEYTLWRAVVSYSGHIFRKNLCVVSAAVNAANRIYSS